MEARWGGCLRAGRGEKGIIRQDRGHPRGAAGGEGPRRQVGRAGAPAGCSVWGAGRAGSSAAHTPRVSGSPGAGGRAAPAGAGRVREAAVPRAPPLRLTHPQPRGREAPRGRGAAAEAVPAAGECGGGAGSGVAHPTGGGFGSGLRAAFRPPRGHSDPRPNPLSCARAACARPWDPGPRARQRVGAAASPEERRGPAPAQSRHPARAEPRGRSHAQPGLAISALPSDRRSSVRPGPRGLGSRINRRLQPGALGTKTFVVAANLAENTERSPGRDIQFPPSLQTWIRFWGGAPNFMHSWESPGACLFLPMPKGSR